MFIIDQRPLLLVLRSLYHRTTFYHHLSHFRKICFALALSANKIGTVRMRNRRRWWIRSPLPEQRRWWWRRKRQSKEGQRNIYLHFLRPRIFADAARAELVRERSEWVGAVLILFYTTIQVPSLNKKNINSKPKNNKNVRWSKAKRWNFTNLFRSINEHWHRTFTAFQRDTISTIEIQIITRDLCRKLL